MHSTNWEQSNRKRKELNVGQSSHQQMDSFFNRVFGHHSSESSRAASPVPPVSQQTQKPEPTSLRHSRNSSTSTIPLSVQAPFLSSANITTATEKNKMQRRRSFDGQTDTKSLKPNPMPTVSVSARASHIPAGRGVQENTVPYPRGDTQIGTSDEDSNSIARSSTVGRNSFQTEERPPKKKIFFRRGKKKMAIIIIACCICCHEYIY